jgi:hypothetical protein
MRGIKMENIISKELLSEVLGEKVREIYKIGSNPNFGSNDLLYKYHRIGGLYNINIYELAHKCKEWGILRGYIIVEYPLCVEIHKEHEPNTLKEKIIDLTTIKYYPSRVFEACEWILNEN